MIRILFVTVVVTSTPAPATAGERGQALKIALLDLATPGISVDQAEALRTSLVGILAAELNGLGHDVVSSADINAMLSYEKQKDLVACADDTACLAEIGGALGAGLMLSGTVGRLGGIFTLSLTLIDTGRAEVVKRFQGNAGTEEALASTAKRGARELLGASAPAGGTGTLLVKTDPAGGIVALDGRQIGPAPVTLDEVPAGDHVITASLGGGEGRLAIQVVGETVERVTVTIGAAPPVKLKVISTPPDAEVYLDDVAVGVTPLLLSDVSAGVHDLRITAKGHRTYAERLALSHAEFESSGRAPFKVEVSLASHLESPLPIAVAVGPVVDGMRPTDGTGLSVELFAAPLAPVRDWFGRLELTFGFVLPLSLTPGIRIRLFEDVLDAGVVLKWPFYRQVRTRTWTFAPGFGVCLGHSFDLPVGRGGVRLETTLHHATANSEQVDSPWTLPVTVALWWGL